MAKRKEPIDKLNDLIKLIQSLCTYSGEESDNIYYYKFTDEDIEFLAEKLVDKYSIDIDDISEDDSGSDLLEEMERLKDEIPNDSDQYESWNEDN